MTQLISENFGNDALTFPTEELYAITTQGELDLFNLELPVHQQITLTGLDSHSYFLSGPLPALTLFELASFHSIGQTTIESIVIANEFTLNDAACPAVIEKIYSVFKTEKP